ncbi:MAG: hypothetical protein FJ144_01390 [Deltaproteobacteria bacterium]|nr:hypothetical protein [Deltaproteobacteria bacterium]
MVACERGDFRVLHYSLQRDHVHLLVEAESRSALARGMKSIGARLARAVNRVFRLRGAVLDGRHHLRVLRTPREVRSALACVPALTPAATPPTAAPARTPTPPAAPNHPDAAAPRSAAPPAARPSTAPLEPSPRDATTC